jgi:hypothetical protein
MPVSVLHSMPLDASASHLDGLNSFVSSYTRVLTKQSCMSIVYPTVCMKEIANMATYMVQPGPRAPHLTLQGRENCLHYRCTSSTPFRNVMVACLLHYLVKCPTILPDASSPPWTRCTRARRVGRCWETIAVRPSVAVPRTCDTGKQDLSRGTRPHVFLAVLNRLELQTTQCARSGPIRRTSQSITDRLGKQSIDAWSHHSSDLDIRPNQRKNALG